MALRGKTIALGAVLEDVIQRMGLRPRIDAARVVEAWAVVAGPQICAVTENARYQDGSLQVQLTSAVWRHSLHAQRSAWRSRLNEELGGNLVHEIIFR